MSLFEPSLLLPLQRVYIAAQARLLLGLPDTRFKNASVTEHQAHANLDRGLKRLEKDIADAVDYCDRFAESNSSAAVKDSPSPSASDVEGAREQHRRASTPRTSKRTSKLIKDQQRVSLATDRNKMEQQPRHASVVKDRIAKKLARKSTAAKQGTQTTNGYRLGKPQKRPASIASGKSKGVALPKHDARFRKGKTAKLKAKLDANIAKSRANGARKTVSFVDQSPLNSNAKKKNSKEKRRPKKKATEPLTSPQGPTTSTIDVRNNAEQKVLERASMLVDDGGNNDDGLLGEWARTISN